MTSVDPFDGLRYLTFWLEAGDNVIVHKCRGLLSLQNRFPARQSNIALASIPWEMALACQLSRTWVKGGARRLFKKPPGSLRDRGGRKRGGLRPYPPSSYGSPLSSLI